MSLLTEIQDAIVNEDNKDNAQKVYEDDLISAAAMAILLYHHNPELRCNLLTHAKGKLKEIRETMPLWARHLEGLS